LKVSVTDGVPSSPAVLASDQNGPAYVAVNSGTVYWIDSHTATIMAIPAAGGSAPDQVASSAFGPSSLTVG
jgi:hypothetical protein